MRVALPWLGYACGVCRYCNSGRETLCPPPATRWTAASPSTRSAMPATSSACLTASIPPTRRR
jgi:threonine dehydrogenase-like Zn-dependent dehydrogenase